MSEVVTVPVDAPRPHPDNPRRGDVPAIMRSLERFGQMKPIVVQKSTGYVIAGNHTLEAAKRLNWPTIKVQLVDVDDDTARAYLIADNRTSDRGNYNKDALLDLLGSQLGNLKGTGYSEEDVEDELVKGDEFNPQAQEKPSRQLKGAGDEHVEEAGKNYDPFRQITLAIRLSEMENFTRQIDALQKHWEVRTTAEVVKMVVDLAYKHIPEPEKGFVAAPASTDF